VLIGKGVTAWRRVLTYMICSTAPNTAQTPPDTGTARTPQASTLPDSVATELIHVLAAVAVALAGT
jgi:hypothetical protein